jgi:SAM-dependent methyltransferase
LLTLPSRSDEPPKPTQTRSPRGGLPGTLGGMATNVFEGWVAERYDALWPEHHAPDAIDPVVDRLVELAGAGPVLELGIGTGRIGLPLQARGVRVHGVELSPDMVDQLRARPGGTDLPVTIGDFAIVELPERFTLVYLLRNTITNLTSEDAQLACFRSVAAHLAPGGRFLIENYVPTIDRQATAPTRVVFQATEEHLGVDEYDVERRIAVSHHCWLTEDGVRRLSSAHRYVWPDELDAMATAAGLVRVERSAGWHGEPFTDASPDHVSIWQKPA